MPLTSIPLAALFSTVVQAEPTTPVDLDGKAPAELVVKTDTGFEIVAWNPDLKKWIEVFDGTGEYTIAAPLERVFADVINDGFVWRWDGARYVARIPRDDIPELSEIPPEVAKAVGEAITAYVPVSTGAAIYEDDDGSKVMFVVLDQSADTCFGDATVCSGVVVRDGKVGVDLGAAVGLGYRISREANAARHRFVEQGVNDGVVVQDADSGEIVRRIEPKEVSISDVQLSVPDVIQE